MSAEQIRKLGGGLAVPLPDEAVRRLKLAAGTPVEIAIEGEALVMRARVHSVPDLPTLVARMKGRTPPEIVDPGPARGAEIA